MPKSSFVERLAPQGRVKGIPRVNSGSSEELILKPDNENVAVITAVMALAKRGLSMLKAKRAIEAMITSGDVVVEVPKVESVEDLAADLGSAGVRVRFRSVENRKLMMDFAGRMKKLRNGLNLSQEEFARAYDFDVKTVRGWESGKKPDRGNQRFILMIEKDPITTKRLVNEF